MERRSFLKAMAAAVAFPFSALKLRAEVAPPLVPGRIRTGWPAFDEALGGGFERNHFVVLKHDASVNENWFLWNLQKVNGADAAAIWQFEPDPDDYLTTPGGGKYPTTARQAARWYRVTYPKVAVSNKVIISPHELKTPIHAPTVIFGQPSVSGAGGHSSDYYGSVVIRARAMGEPGLVKYTITKCRCGPGFRSILVRHYWWFGALYSKQVEVVDVGDSPR